MTAEVATTARTIAMAELEQGARTNERALNDAGEISNPLRHVRVRLTVCVGGTELTIGELLDAKAHQVLRLDQAIGHPVDVLLEGQVVARGELVAVEDRFGVRITDLPLALDAPLASPRKA